MTFAERVAAEIRAELGRQGVSIAALAREMRQQEMYVRRRVGAVAEPVALDLNDVESIARALGKPLEAFLRLPIAA